MDSRSHDNILLGCVGGYNGTSHSDGMCTPRCVGNVLAAGQLWMRQARAQYRPESCLNLRVEVAPRFDVDISRQPMHTV